MVKACETGRNQQNEGLPLPFCHQLHHTRHDGLTVLKAFGWRAGFTA